MGNSFVRLLTSVFREQTLDRSFAFVQCKRVFRCDGLGFPLDFAVRRLLQIQSSYVNEYTAITTWLHPSANFVSLFLNEEANFVFLSFEGKRYLDFLQYQRVVI